MNAWRRLALTASIALACNAAALADVSTAPAAPTGKLVAYHAVLTPQYDGVGQYDGTLRIAISASGIVSGTYVNQDGRFQSVSGGMRGNEIWFDIGSASNIHVSGTYEKGIIRGYSRISGKSFDFTAKAAKKI